MVSTEEADDYGTGDPSKAKGHFMLLKEASASLGVDTRPIDKFLLKLKKGVKWQ